MCPHSQMHPGANGATMSVLEVESYTPATLGALASLPRTFAVLTVDAEGVDVQVLRGFITAGYRPLFAILELKGHDRVTRPDADFMRAAGYEELAHVGPNYIWEHATPRR